MAARRSTPKTADHRKGSNGVAPSSAVQPQAGRQSAELTPAQREQARVREMLGRYEPQIRELLKGEDPKRFLRTIHVSIATTPKLTECTPASLVGAMLEVATLRLEVGVLGEAWILPYWNSKAKVSEAQLIVGYRGFMKLARNTNQVGPIQASIVREGEDFVYRLGTKEPIRHTPAMDPEGQKRPWVGAYAYAYIRGFDVPQVAYMTAEEIVEIKSKSPSASRGFGPWVDHEASMWMKSPVRQLAKFLPMSAEMQKAVSLDQLADAGQSQHLGAIPEAFGLGTPQLSTVAESDASGAEGSSAEGSTLPPQ